MPIWYSSIITPDGEFYLIGGGNPEYDNYDCPKVDTIFKYNEKENDMEIVARLSSPRDVMGACYNNGYIYICCGRNDKIEYIKSTERLDVTTHKIEQLSDCISPSGQPSIIALNERFIFKIGGWIKRFVPNDCIERFDILQNKWEVIFNFNNEKSQIKMYTCGGVAKFADDQIICFGGWYDNFNSITERTFVLKQDFQNNNQVQIQNYNKVLLPSRGGFWFPQSVAHNGKIYVLQNIESRKSDGCFLSAKQRVLCFNGEEWGILKNDNKGKIPFEFFF